MLKRKPKPDQRRKWYSRLSLLAFVLFLVPPFAVSFLGSQWTDTDPGTWYDQLSRPGWEPPGWAFGVVWTILYFLMGVAAWLVWLTKSKLYPEAVPLGFWTVQLGFNLGWTYAFFQQESPIAGVVVILLLWIAIVLTMVMFAPKSKKAALLLLPYLAWVTYAAALNIEIARMNPLTG